MSERAWLVEWHFNGVQWLYLWPSAPGGFSFTSDASKALRFARREDAEAALQWARETDAARRPIGSLTRHGLALGEMLVTEHDWPALNAAPSAQEPDHDLAAAWKSGARLQYLVITGHDDDWTDYTGMTPPDLQSSRLAWRIAPGAAPSAQAECRVECDECPTVLGCLDRCMKAAPAQPILCHRNPAPNASQPMVPTPGVEVTIAGAGAEIRMVECPGCGMEFADGALHNANLELHRLKKAAQAEPVAWIRHEWSGTGQRSLSFDGPPDPKPVRDEVVNPVWTPLYAAPPAAQAEPQVPLEELRRLAQVALRESEGAPLVQDWMAAALAVCRGIGKQEGK